jgi:hypothetical protein
MTGKTIRETETVCSAGKRAMPKGLKGRNVPVMPDSVRKDVNGTNPWYANLDITINDKDESDPATLNLLRFYADRRCDIIVRPRIATEEQNPVRDLNRSLFIRQKQQSDYQKPRTPDSIIRFWPYPQPVPANSNENLENEAN